MKASSTKFFDADIVNDKLRIEIPIDYLGFCTHIVQKSGSMDQLEKSVFSS
jgi:hypothetical protein